MFDLIIGIILLIVGILYLFKPFVMWKLDHYFQRRANNDLKPNDNYYIIIKWIAIICILFGIYLIVTYFI